ncbi:NAD(P)-dependent alcohol dehydrogenase [Microbacterium sp. ZXX196]|uniref:NAD(P)-dependent alcohol dehydrogenase n=1 Tax=Microbacterium sp. ZXX196 TaxID=2609291 RepID=UPI0012B99B70|nr:NAD(P)-dependent alcohol dehydrogenase [Microbacterium sp. ZXX196]MTE23036.1 alcohol dehydrogenase catalytic domain-containing protein [Microbacterium sp. ZXX196]
MKALQYVSIGQPPEVREVPTPEPGPGQVRLKVTAAGACHSDEFLMSLPEEVYTAAYPLPMTLGHEGAGIVDKVGEGVTEVAVGDAVAVYGPWGCGRCYPCSQGKENYCERAAELGITPPGLGHDGSMAEYMIVDSPRFLVPLGDLDAVKNVALTDAGLTPYHAIKGSLDKLVAGSTAVVIGTGGLGHVAIQILRALTPATVIALDVSDEKLQLAKDVGAHHAFASNPEAVDRIREATGSATVTAVFDFVNIQPTVDLGSALSGVETDLVLVGVGGNTAQVGMMARPYDATIRSPYWGSRPELMEVLNLARTGLVGVETETFSLDDAPEAYRRLHEGSLRGRAVVTP